MSGLKWTKTPEEAMTELTEAYMSDIERAVTQLLKFYEKQIENHMRTNAPWKDRTGNARQALFAQFKTVVKLLLLIEFGQGHAIDYGVYLEFSNAGKYAIVNPTLDIFAPRIWADIERMLR